MDGYDINDEPFEEIEVYDGEVPFKLLPEHDYSKQQDVDQGGQSMLTKSNFDPLWGVNVFIEETIHAPSSAWDEEVPASGEEAVIDFAESSSNINDTEVANVSNNQPVSSVHLAKIYRETKSNSNQSEPGKRKSVPGRGCVPVRGPGRPRVAPEVHLSKIHKKLSKQQRKTLNNNAASCRYRHKKIAGIRLAEAKERKGRKRNEYLKAKLEKLKIHNNKMCILLKIADNL